MRHACAFVVMMLVALAAAPTQAQDRRGPGLHAGQFRKVLFPPELLMRHAEELSLEKAQRETIIREIQQMESDIVPVQWQIREEMEKLRVLLDQHRVDEKEVLARAEEVADLEATLKRRHRALLVRIKNVLTEEQQETLKQFRGRAGRGKPGRQEARRPSMD